MVNEHASINYSPDSLTQFNALAQLAQQGLIPNTTFIRRAALRARALPGLSGRCSASTGRSRRSRSGSCAARWTITPPITPWCSRRRCPPPARLRTPIMECGAQQQYTFSPTWLGQFTFDASYLHATADAQRLSRIRAGLPVQLHFEDHLRLRNLRRQPVRNRDHGVSGLAQPGEISVQVRRERTRRGRTHRSSASTSSTSRC